jgi:hypothetical protein
VFRRTKSSDSPTTEQAAVAKEGGKGRPTPTRKEAEAARKARAKAAANPKAAPGKAGRADRAAHNARVREAMRSGDERYLPQRDKGPVRRYIRDWVDARLCMAELLLPLLVVVMVSQAISPVLANGIWTATILLVALDTAWLTFRLRRALRAQFPDESQRGAVFYAVMRALQIRWLRMPKPQVRIGGAAK